MEGLLSNPDPQAQWDWLTKEYQGRPDDPPYLNVQSLRNAQDPKEAAWGALDALACLLSGDPRVSKDRLDE